jgi:hypothetical protein
MKFLVAYAKSFKANLTQFKEEQRKYEAIAMLEKQKQQELERIAEAERKKKEFYLNYDNIEGYSEEIKFSFPKIKRTVVYREDYSEEVKMQRAELENKKNHLKNVFNREGELIETVEGMMKGLEKKIHEQDLRNLGKE